MTRHPCYTHIHTDTQTPQAAAWQGRGHALERPGPWRPLLPPDHAGPSLKNTFRHDQNRPYSSGLPSLKMHQASQTLGSKRPRRTHSRRMEAFPGPHRHPGSCVSLAFWRPSRHHCLPLSFNHSIPISFWKLGCSLSRPSFKTPRPAAKQEVGTGAQPAAQTFLDSGL